MFLKYYFLVLCAIFVCCESAFVDILAKNKCSINDGECQSGLFNLGFKEIGKTGLPEYGLLPFDPYEIKNISIAVLGMIDIGMVDGIAKGIKNCNFNHLDTSIENLHSTMDITCSVSLKGRYKVFGNSSLITNLLGGASVRGDGFAKINIERLHIIADFDFFLREANNEIFIDWYKEKSRFQFEYGKVSFAADNLRFGEVDVSLPIISTLNGNWKFFITTFGKPFVDLAMGIVDNFAHKFFDAVPARFYITEDLKSYLPK